MNIVIVRGILSRPGECRTLPSGDCLVAYDLTVREGEGPAEIVPVVVPGEPAVVHDEGTELLVTGRVRRRFFRAGGATQSRTEVVAEAVVVATDQRRVRRAIDRALAGTLRTPA
jgi:single-strand DNA-binding protein